MSKIVYRIHGRKQLTACALFSCLLVVINAQAQKNLVPNGMLAHFTADSIMPSGNQPRAANIINWEGNTCQTYYNTTAGQSPAAFVLLVLYQQLGKKDAEVWNAETKLCRPLHKGQTYLVEAWVKPLTGTAFCGGISVAFSNKHTNTKLFYEVSTKRTKATDTLPGLVPAYKHAPAIRNTGNYTRLTFEYTAKGGEQYLYVGNFNQGKPDVWENTTPFGYMRPVFDYSAYSIYALGGISVVPKDSTEAGCEPASNTTVVLPEAVTPDTLYLGNVYFESNQHNQALNLNEVMLPDNGNYNKLLLIGYADESGNEALNNRLSLKRAEYVARLLKGKFNKPTISIGLGVSNSKHQKNQNRRVEVYLIK